jgi:hypothetical protein
MRRPAYVAWLNAQTKLEAAKGALLLWRVLGT